jgi:hypothetical protein
MKTRDYWHDPYAIYLTLLNAIDDTHDIEPMAAEIHDSKYEAVGRCKLHFLSSQVIPTTNSLIINYDTAFCYS